MDPKATGAELAPLSKESAALYRQSTDVAGLCKELVTKTALDIQGRKFVRVEGWSSIAVAHGFVPSIKSVEMTDDGTKAIAELKRINGGEVISTAEGYVGRDEPVWYGGPDTAWNRKKQTEEEVIRKKRPDYAIRAMAQTRAISRVCRSAFSHCVVLMDAGLSTVPAEEVHNEDDIPMGDGSPNGEIEKGQERARAAAEEAMEKKNAAAAAGAKKEPEVPRDVDPALREQFRGKKWEAVKLHWSKHKGRTLGELEANTLKWFANEWQPKPFGAKGISQDDKLLRAALDVAIEENAIE